VVEAGDRGPAEVIASVVVLQTPAGLSDAEAMDALHCDGDGRLLASCRSTGALSSDHVDGVA
jgi:hypothetical protein